MSQSGSQCCPSQKPIADRPHCCLVALCWLECYMLPDVETLDVLFKGIFLFRKSALFMTPLYHLRGWGNGFHVGCTVPSPGNLARITDSVS